MKKRDVLFLCQFFYPEYISSATLPFDTAKELSKSGLSVGALCGYPKEYSLKKFFLKNEIVENIKIKRLKYLQLKRSNLIGRIINYFSFTVSVMFSINTIRKYKIVVVYSNPPILPVVSLIAKKLFRIKIVFVSYDVYPEIATETKSISESGIIFKFMNFLNRIFFRNVTKVVALSSEMKEFLFENRVGLKYENIKVIPNWVENNNKSNIIRNEEFKKINSEYKMVISYFGNMGICQDLKTIIEAIRELKEENEILFLFAGHGIKMDKLKKIKSEENLKNLKIYDFLHGQDFQDALNISNCFIVSLYEGLTGLCVPSKTYSYLSAGKPVIAIMDEDSDISRDLKKYRAGYTIKNNDVNDFIEKIKYLMNNPENIKSMGEGSRKVYLEKYTKEVCNKKYVNMINDILNGESDYVQR